MSSNPANKYITHRKFNNNYQSIVVASDIENVMLIANIIGSWEMNLLCDTILISLSFNANV